MIDHLSLRVKDYSQSKAFYLTALAPLGYGLMMEFDDHGGLGAHGKPDFWIVQDAHENQPTHIAFAAADRPTVDAFYKAALDAGGRDNGSPGLRAHYHADYYAAFVTDPNGNNIEAVCHRPMDE